MEQKQLTKPIHARRHSILELNIIQHSAGGVISPNAVLQTGNNPPPPPPPNNNTKPIKKMNTIKEIRKAFWATFPELDKQARKNKTRSKRQNFQTCTTRCAFVDFVDSLARSGDITSKQANNATL